MWTAQSTKLADPLGQKFTLAINSRPAAFLDVIDAWQNDMQFRLFFNSLLADSGLAAFRWETPSVTIDSLSKPFEFALIDSPELARQARPDAFAEHFTDGNADIAVFPNLGGDATMVVPYPVAEPSAYGHIAAFVRLAPEEQRHHFWMSIGRAMVQRVNAKRIWLSTAGAGVPWLHGRVDDAPKYYTFAPYRQ